jgi:3-deoxy-manno-octulosonate cytidylyltransferase (CMP-KDO synthetase)
MLMATPSLSKNGTERCYWAASYLDITDDTYIVNVQCDQPMIDPVMLLKFRHFLDQENPDFATIALDVGLGSKNTVKVMDGTFFREPVYKHVGVYAYTYAALKEYIELEPTEEEKELSLEQLRFKIPCELFIYPDYGHISVDTEEDLEKCRLILTSRR